MTNQFPSITNLIPKLVEGDSDAWNQLVGAFSPGLSATAQRMIRGSKLKRRLDADELVNIALAKAWDRHQSLAAQTTRQVASFLLTTMRRTFIDEGRPLNLESSKPTWFAPTGQERTPSAIAISAEEEVRLHAALAEVPDKHREVLIMRHFEGMKFREIAEKLDVSIGVVAGLARDGLKVLTEHMSDCVEDDNSAGG